MGDDLNKCKDCTKKDSKKRQVELRKNPEWVEKEKERAKEKYNRLNYKEKQKVWNKKRPWTQNQIYKNLHRLLNCDKGNSLHHWCYNDESLKDVFEMLEKDHRKLHRFIKIDYEYKMFRTLNGELLDTKQKHWDYWLSVKNIS